MWVIKSKRKAISQVTPFEKFKEAVENYHEMTTEELKLFRKQYIG
jgi:hypothetical protein